MKLFPSALGPVHLGSVNDGLARVIKALNAPKVVLIADDLTAMHCVPKVKAISDAVTLIVIPHGEKYKNLDQCVHIWSSLIEAEADRSTLLLNVGGGIICDIGGFAASCFQRGIRFAHIPTSLLAMADAAIGGKSGVNFEGFKNYIGQIEAPAFTWIDPSFLATLPQKEIINGFAEITKHAIIASPPLWELISKYEELESVDWTSILAENTPVKQKITDTDPDEKGLRKILNFGHTIGHALESFFIPADHPMSHGQAVTLGMLAESRIANQMGLLNEADFIRITSLISRLLAPSQVPLPPMDALRGWLAGDKKKVSGQVGYSLPDHLGSCRWNVFVEDQYLQESMNWLTTHLRAYSGRLSMES